MQMNIASNSDTITNVFSGYGGGYNDRGVVEYKERKEESDGEFDDFGRRKRKRDEKRDERRDEKRTNHREESSSNSRNESGHRWENNRNFMYFKANANCEFLCWPFSKRPKNDKDESDDSEDEDSDSDDDDSKSGDISKYQLFDSESDTEKQASVQKKRADTVSPRSKRSRSKWVAFCTQQIDFPLYWFLDWHISDHVHTRPSHRAAAVPAHQTIHPDIGHHGNDNDGARTADHEANRAVNHTAGHTVDLVDDHHHETVRGIVADKNVAIVHSPV